jgi:hypothetical protein
MRNSHSYWCCGLIGGLALVALGPAQMASPFTHTDSPHAPMVHIYGPDGVPLRGPHNESMSGNWSGYALTSGTYTSATFAWVVPTVTFIAYASTPGFESSSTWVGIGGFSTGDLIQLGTEQYVASNGSAIYRAWTEVLPANEVYISGCTPAGKSSCPVSAGDAMTASLTCTSNCTANNSSTTWTLAMADSTQGWSFTGNFTYASCLCSAEWIQEAPSYNNNIVPMPNYGVQAFNNLTVNGGNPNLSLSADGIILVDCQGGNRSGNTCTSGSAGGFSAPCGAFNGNSFLTSYGLTCDNVVLSRNFNDDDTSDILWRDTSGNLAIWEMKGGTILNPSSTGLGGVATTWSLVGQRDFNGDGYADMLWHDSSGNLAIWEMNGTTILNPSSSGLGTISTAWSVAGVGDFNGDGRADILWRDTTGDVAIWEMNGTTILNPSSSGVGTVATNWEVVGVGDFNGDGKADILWQNNINGNLTIYLMNGTTITSSATIGNPGSYSVVGTGDFNGDGKSDILLRDGSGDVEIWEMNGTTILNPNSTGVGNLSTAWSVAGVGDYNGDGMSDILWRDTSGDTAIWYMNGTTLAGGAGLGTISTTFTIQNTNAD